MPRRKWTARDIPDQSGRVAVVTGSNTGIGLETVAALARRGAHVVLACRDQAKGRSAADGIAAAGVSGTLDVMVLDLADLASVRAFSAAFRDGFDRLDLLVNNAGVMWPPASKTVDGFELQFGTNHLGHFALTARLLERLRTTSGRVWSPSSAYPTGSARSTSTTCNGSRGRTIPTGRTGRASWPTCCSPTSCSGDSTAPASRRCRSRRTNASVRAGCVP